MRYQCLVWITGGIVLASCSTTRYASNQPAIGLPEQEVFKNAHLGISLFDATAGNYLYNYQAEKYFVPASNAKIFTLYAGMKYLNDSLPGVRYDETADTLFIYPTADPTFLHPDFNRQPVIDMLQKTTKQVVVVNDSWKEDALGSGWSWDDYNESYMVERSSWPVYGNVIKWIQSSQKNTQPELEDSMQTFVFSEPEVNWKVKFRENRLNKTFKVNRKRDENYFEVSQGDELFKEQLVPFVTKGISSALELLKDTVHREIMLYQGARSAKGPILYSQPADSLFKPMMYRSDNFFAEQILLMAANAKMGVMNDKMIIDTMLIHDLAGLPQKPNWVDGSGLSRYNLFTPQDFVWILNRMKEEFGMERIKAFFPSGGQGTLRDYYKKDSGYIFAKTGSMSGLFALSGYLITPKNKLLIFSVLVNNHQGNTIDIQRAIEQFLTSVRRKY